MFVFKLVTIAFVRCANRLDFFPLEHNHFLRQRSVRDLTSKYCAHRNLFSSNNFIYKNHLHINSRMSSSFDFMALPAEIRIRVYEIYWEDEQVDVNPGIFRSGRQSAQLLCDASPTFEREARPVFYQVATWHFCLDRIPIRNFCQWNRFPIRKIETRGLPVPFGGLSELVNILNTSNGRPPGLAAVKKMKFQVFWDNGIDSSSSQMILS